MRHARSAQRTAAFTLLEMIVVLALLVLAAALVWPSMRRSLQQNQLTNSAKLVRNALARARLAAIESGQPYAFRWEIGGRRYEVRAVSLPRPTPSARDRAAQRRQSEGLSEPMLSEDLPLGITFAADEEPVASWAEPGSVPAVQPGARPPQHADVARQSDSATALADGAIMWSDSIVFEPQGNTADAAIRLSGEAGLSTTLWLRGLTGTAIIDSPQRIEAQP